MKFVDEYRDAPAVLRLAEELRRCVTRPWTLMEVCGGQTHAILRFGLEQMLPPGLSLVHGPGCPVCVTPASVLDQAVLLTRQPHITLCTFGDMIRVPGNHGDLLRAKAEGADVRVVYSPMDAVRYARENPGREVIFLAVGFETTAPANAMAALQAHAEKLPNFSLLTSQVMVPPAIAFLLESPGNTVQGFLAAGHVCTIMGTEEYLPLAARYRVPMVVTGFEPLDIMDGILRCVRQLEAGRAEVENAYARAVRPEGNPAARSLLDRAFHPVDREWRGIGVIPKSGLGLRDELSAWDAAKKFPASTPPAASAPSPCQSGLVLQGRIKPTACPEFGRTCTPEHPLGATMVSSEGACAAYYRYRGAAT
jgi:hydrogenase expression/formation protein HypD